MLKALNKLPSLLSSIAQEATFANISPRTLPQFCLEYPMPDILLPPPNIYLTNFLLWKLHVCPSSLPICRGQRVPWHCCRQILLQLKQIWLQIRQILLEISSCEIAHLPICRGQMTVWGSMVSTLLWQCCNFDKCCRTNTECWDIEYWWWERATLKGLSISWLGHSYVTTWDIDEVFVSTGDQADQLWVIHCPCQ